MARSMSAEIITRDAMVAAMEAQFSADVRERRGQNWQRLNTVLAEQGEGHGDYILGFHLFELCHRGHLIADYRSELESGDRQNDIQLLPGALQYAQAFREGEFWMRGEYTVQQIYIDDAVFREVAAGIAPGDPDRLQPLGFHGIYDPHLKSIALAILEEGRWGAPGGELYADLLAQQLALAILRRNLRGKQKPLPARRLSDAELKRVIDFMETNLEDVGGLPTLAGLVDMDVFSFSRAFKARTGEAPHRFLVGRRLERVKEMLVNSSESLAEIAYATGFSNQAHMTASFTKLIGTPPGAYRKAVRN